MYHVREPIDKAVIRSVATLVFAGHIGHRLCHTKRESGSCKYMSYGGELASGTLLREISCLPPLTVPINGST